MCVCVICVLYEIHVYGVKMCGTLLKVAGGFSELTLWRRDRREERREAVGVSVMVPAAIPTTSTLWLEEAAHNW